SRTSWQDGDDVDRKTRMSWTLLKSESDGQSPDMDPRTSTHSLPTDMSQPNFSYNKSASLPGYGHNGIYKAADLGEDEHDSTWGAMRGEGVTEVKEEESQSRKRRSFRGGGVTGGMRRSHRGKRGGVPEVKEEGSQRRRRSHKGEGGVPEVK
ncbi:actin-binding LIM protein 2 isoform X1, partial [Tachysurus ichikawai]